MVFANFKRKNKKLPDESCDEMARNIKFVPAMVCYGISCNLLNVLDIYHFSSRVFFLGIFKNSP